MIAADYSDIRDLVFRLADKQYAGVLGLGVSPFICFFIIEAYDWLRNHKTAEADIFLETNAGRIRHIRARVKLFGDQEGYEIALQRLEAVQRATARMFEVQGRGIVGRLRRWLQTDLGCYFIGPDLVCTTDVAVANFGLPEAELDRLDRTAVGALHYDVRILGEELGSFLGRTFDLSGQEPREMALLQPLGRPAEENHKATEAYSRLALRLGIEDVRLAAQFTFLVSQVNFVHIVLPSLLEQESDLLFRFKFLTMFHLTDEFRRIGAITQGDPSHVLGRVAADIQSRPGIRRIRRLRDLRNALAHYDASGLGEGVDGNRCLDELVADRAKEGRSELSGLLDQEFEAASQRFRSVLAKGSLRGRVREPHGGPATHVAE